MTMAMSLRARSRQDGQASVELVAMMSLLLVVAFGVWQVLLGGWAATSASNAARTGSRVASRGGDGGGAAKGALSSALRDHAQVRTAGETTYVKVRVPILIPGVIDSDALTVTKKATVPRTTP
jgi:Flp pilus assembly protein TadG